MTLRPKHAALLSVLFASACAVVTGINEYSTGNADGGAAPGNGDLRADGGATSDADVVPTPADGGSLPPDCKNGQIACESATTAAKCENEKWTRTACPERCTNGACAPYPSCEGDAGAGCGLAPRSCCASLPVPGGTFHRRNDTTLPATVSAFELDAFEVTVGRFRAFLAAGGATQAHPPVPGSGAHPKLPNSGWHVEWNQRLPVDVAGEINALDDGKRTWTDAPGANEHRPINNIDWLQAFAFCAWDGGRLPTYAELSFAYVGGDEQRVYPWSTTSNPQQPTRANAAFDCNFDPPSRSCSTTCIGCSENDVAPVGSLPAGAGKWGHFDLAGNVTELALDLSDPPDDARPPTVCDDCAVLLSATDPEKAVIGTKQFVAQVYQLGGAYDGNDKDLQGTAYDRRRYNDHRDQNGFRCARDARVTPTP